MERRWRGEEVEGRGRRGRRGREEGVGGRLSATKVLVKGAVLLYDVLRQAWG